MTHPLHRRARIQQAADRDVRVQPVRTPIDWACVDRNAAYAAERRREMGEARWQELMKEWK